MRGRIGALAMHARNDSRVTSAPGRAAADARFAKTVIEEAASLGEELSDDEVARRADLLRRKWMTQLAYKSARAYSAESDQSFRGFRSPSVGGRSAADAGARFSP